MDTNEIITNEIITVVILTIWAVLVQGQPQYEVQVELPLTFTHRGGLSPMGVPYVNRLANGNCCSSNEGGNSCPTACETIITVCFREAQHPVNDNNTAICPLGTVTVNTFAPGAGIHTLSATEQAATTTYPGSFQLYYRIVSIINGEEVDSGQQTLTQPIQDRTPTLTVTGSSSISGARTTLFLSGGPRVVCREGYFGPNCGCSPRDDSTGHFTCDTNGIKVCLPGYQNPQTNCVEEEGTTTEPLTINNQDTNTEGTTVTTKPSSTSIVMVSTAPETTFTMQEFTSNSDVAPSAACADIVHIVAGGVAGGLVVLVLILIVNIVLVVGVLKFKFMKHYSNKRGSAKEKHITMGANPVYEMRAGGHSRPEDNVDYEIEIVR